jgi:hypothetical protein
MGQWTSDAFADRPRTPRRPPPRLVSSSQLKVSSRLAADSTGIALHFRRRPIDPGTIKSDARDRDEAPLVPRARSSESDELATWAQKDPPVRIRRVVASGRCLDCVRSSARPKRRGGHRGCVSRTKIWLGKPSDRPPAIGLDRSAFASNPQPRGRYSTWPRASIRICRTNDIPSGRWIDLNDHRDRMKGSSWSDL